MELKYGPVYHFPLSGDELPLSLSFIGKNYCEPKYTNVRNKATITVIAYVLQGSGTVTVDNESHIVKSGDVFILPVDRYHKVVANPNAHEQWVYIWFNITGDLVIPLLESYKLLDSIVIENAPVAHWFKLALQYAQSKSAQEMHAELPVILHQIVIALSNLKYRNAMPYSSEVQKIKNYLDNQIQASFHSDKLSKHIGLSFKQINRLFKKETGSTVYKYVLSKKIDSAQMMLQETDLTIGQIAFQLGYTDPHYFSNLFKKKTGMSPSQYREQQHL